jgi:3-hydroxyacyl-CoA dehydrogenase/enoyl-CoA hydratase/3-hydroxybutyryl-CoA epimerase/enoyl-CoA isomerase
MVAPAMPVLFRYPHTRPVTLLSGHVIYHSSDDEVNMIFEGSAIQVRLLDSDIAEFRFDLQGESVNKFDAVMIAELQQALQAVQQAKLAGLLITSGKSAFMVGADVTEFDSIFAKGEDAIQQHLARNNDSFNQLEDLPFPTVVAINGFALGGGLEFCLACDYRIASTDAKVGLPETKLGLIPGWGGTVRLPRVAGLDTAVEWIASGREQSADKALKAGVVDGVVAPEALHEAALKTLLRLTDGRLEYERRRAQKRGPLKHNKTENLLAFESSKAFVEAEAGRHYPAPVSAIKVMQEAANLNRDQALAVETRTFSKLAQTSAAQALVGLFVSDQLLGKKVKHWEKQADRKVARAAVLGAGIMGGGIAYQSALKNVPIKMKDIAQAGLDLGLGEAAKLFAKGVDRGRMTPIDMAKAMSRIEPTLSYDGFGLVDLVVEAVVENPKVKHAVLAEVEKQVDSDTVLCSNTSTISISRLAQALQRPENFCGMHFFNPVHAMPLVEVIRGEKTSDKAVARTVAYANALGKKPVVIQDCPGFLVNRVLFPYFAGFSMLVRDGANFQQVDKVMERWGWPMGPAYLLDVVGIDTGVHAESVMAEGFPERMTKHFKACTDVIYEAGRYGQKNSKGFYDYQLDKRGKQEKVVTDEPYRLLKPFVAEPREFDDQDVIARLMVPMATELARCLDEGIVASAEEADMALIYGLGFPPFRGGIFRWIDDIGIDAFIAMASRFADLSPLYVPPDAMQQKAADHSTYYSANGARGSKENGQ